MKSIYLFLLLLLFSCSNQDARIDSIQKELSLTFPKDFEVTQDDDVSHNDFEGDYTQTVSIEFQKKDIPNIVKQITSSPYYNELEHFNGRSHSPYERNDSLSKELFIVKDSLKTLEVSGTWVRKANTFIYIDFFDWSESCKATFELRTGELWFERTSL